MTDEELIVRLNSTSEYLKTKSEENLQELGISSCIDLGSQPQKQDPGVELGALLARHGEGLTTAAELRRIAELVELLHGEEEAFEWWRRAADRGDVVAVLMLEDEAEREKR